jgi:predicted nucleic acid-binding protein
MRIIVSDSSCLIDLRKGGLLEAFLELPFEFVIPDVLLENELLSLSRAERTLLRRSMEVAVLEEDGVKRAEEVLAETPALSTYDAFAFVVAEEREHAILLTGGRRLRGLAETHKIEVHGVLWVVDQLVVHGKASERAVVSRFWFGRKTQRFVCRETSSRNTLISTAEGGDAGTVGQTSTSVP